MILSDIHAGIELKLLRIFIYILFYGRTSKPIAVVCFQNNFLFWMKTYRIWQQALKIFADRFKTALYHFEPEPTIELNYQYPTTRRSARTRSSVVVIVQSNHPTLLLQSRDQPIVQI